MIVGRKARPTWPCHSERSEESSASSPRASISSNWTLYFVQNDRPSFRYSRLIRLAGALVLAALGLAHDAFAQAQAFRRDLHKFVGRDVLDRALKRHLRCRREADADAFALGAEVRELLFAHGIDRDVLVAGILADDHALVNLLARANEELAALLAHHQRIGGGLAGLGGDEGAGDAGEDFAGVGAVFLEEMAEHSAAAGGVDDVDLHADEAAGGDGRLDH